MPIRHTVKQGECLHSIAAAYGWLPASLWDHPDNTELKKLRGAGDVLAPGDVMVIPDRRPKTEKRRTGARHVFRRKGIPHTLRVRFMGYGAPLAGRPYTIRVDGVASQGTTDGDGWANIPIPPGARAAHVEIEGEEYDLALGHLDPVDRLSGLQQRLANLGFYKGPIDEKPGAPLDDATKDALVRFQEASELDASGEADDATKQKLKELNGA